MSRAWNSAIVDVVILEALNKGGEECRRRIDVSRCHFVVGHYHQSVGLPRFQCWRGHFFPLYFVWELQSTGQVSGRYHRAGMMILLRSR